MRPLKIEMNYFGPYDQAVVDFTQFDQRPLFLVAGNTGAGKTTIFDAMCYALFGQTTNDRDRSAAALRSDFAPADQETRVTFTFSHQGRTYRIMRKPKQSLENKKSRLIDHNQAVELVYPLESDQPHAITKIKTADSFISNLLNLNRDQFRQIVLLPQGKFRQFLDSDSSAKESLLRDLFNTNQYAQWAQELKDELADQRQKLAKQETRLQSIMEIIPEVDKCRSVADWQTAAEKQQSALKRQQAAAQAVTTQQQETVNRLNQELHQQEELQQAIADLAAAQKQAVQLQERQPEIAKKKEQLADLQWFQRHQAAYQRWHDGETQLTGWQKRARQLERRLTELHTAQAQADQEYQSYHGQQAKYDRLRDRQKALTEALPLFAECDQLAAAVALTKERLTAKKSDQKAQQKQAASLEKQVADLRLQLTAAGDLAAQEQALGQQERQHDQLTRDAQDLKNLLADQDEQEEQLEQGQDELARAAKSTEQAQVSLADLKDKYARHQIARLARDLKPGTPCPVCGAVDHPAPAHFEAAADQLVTDAQLQAATDQLEKYQARMSRSQERVAVFEKQLADLAKKLKEASGRVMVQLGAETLPANWAAQVQERGAKLKAKEEQLEQQKSLAAEGQERLTDLQNQLSDLQQADQQLVDQINKLEQEAAKQTAVLAGKQTSLPKDIADERTARHQLADWKKQLADFNDRLDQAAQHQQEVQKQLAVAQSSQKENDRNIQDGQQKQRERHQELVRDLAAYRPGLSWDFWESVQGQVGQLADLQSTLTNYQTAVHDNQQLQERLQKQVADHPAPDLAATKRALDNAQEQLGQSQHQVGQLAARQDQLTTALARVDKLVRQNQAAETDLAALGTLSDVVNGNTENHLSLERYVLQSYFREVLVAANDQLARLTNHRYQFELSTVSHGAGAKWTGLEVSVYDDNAGKTRSARTLSGGESFMASLALALGLCQIIQEQSGGISIDSLFIDEGFGSLDQQALTDALRALQELEGHRMIGIISHVTELEEQIPDQLRVSSVNGRSRISYQHELHS